MGVRTLKIVVIVIIAIILPICILAAVPTATPTIGPGFLYENFATNGTVFAMTRTANTLYLGGSFTRIGQKTGSMIVTDTYGNQLTTPRFPQVDSYVYACISDGSGGFYIGGSFNYVAGVYRAHLAHIFSDGTLDPAWAPQVDGNVRALAIWNSKVYIGGAFTNAGGTGASLLVARGRACAVDAVTGALTGFNPNFDSTVYSIGTYSTIRMMFGGAFTQAYGATNKYLICIDTTTDPGVNAYTSDYYGVDGTVYSIAMNLYMMYIGGSFTHVNITTARNYMAYYSSFANSVPTTADFNCNSWVMSLSYNSSNSTIYATGYFSTVNAGTVTRYYAAAFNSSGVATSWNPNLNSSGNAIFCAGSTIYVGGYFTRVNGGAVRDNAAAFDSAGGTVNAWAPNPDGLVYMFAQSGSNIAICGTVRAYKSYERNYMAAVWLPYYYVYNWDPSPDSTVYSLAAAGGVIYAGGAFSNVNTTTSSVVRPYAAAFGDVTTVGTANSWNPSPNGTVRALCPAGTSIMYMGGDFTSVATTTRYYGAAVDMSTGATVYGWNPNTNGTIRAITQWGGIYYIGGDFTTTAGGANTRNYIACISLGNTTTWDPNLNGSVYAIAAAPEGIYLGGAFTTISAGTVTRNRVALVKPNGTVMPFDPNANSTVYSLERNYAALLLGGAFNVISGSTRNYAAAIDMQAGALSAWNPSMNSYVWSIASYSNYVALGGYFLNSSNLPAGYGAEVECPQEMYTFTYTPTPTFSMTYTLTSTPSYTFTQTVTKTITPTMTQTFTITMTWSLTPTFTVTPTITLTATQTVTPTATPTFTQTQAPVYMAPFQDNFSTDKNWDYGTEYQRGPAAASSGQSAGNPDPSQDHTQLGDNYVAGTVIGGNMSTSPMHSEYYFMSPYINTSALSSVQLRFWKYLNTDYVTYIPCKVDVFDGTNWINIFTSGPTGTFESAWNEVVYDVTAYKNPKFRIRFSHAVIMASGCWTMSGWNIDDVYCGAPFTPTSTPTYTSTPTSTVTLTSSPSFTMTASSTYTPTVTMTSTLTVTNTSSATPTFTPTPTITQSYTAAPTSTIIIVSATNTPTFTVSPTFTATPTSTPTYSVTKTGTPTMTATPTFTCTSTATYTVTATYSVTSTGTYTPTVVITNTNTPRPSETYTLTHTVTPTPTVTATDSPTSTFTATDTYTTTSTSTVTATSSPADTSTFTVTMTDTPVATASYTETAADTATPSITMTATLFISPTPTQQCQIGMLGNSSWTNTKISAGSSLYASSFDLVQGATMMNIHVNVVSGSGNIIVAIYSDTAGQPDSLVLPSSPQGAVVGWNTVSMPVMSLPAGRYWLALQATSGLGITYSNTSPSYSGVSTANSFGMLPDPFGPAAPMANRWSIYSDFCPDLGYLVTPTITPTAAPTGTITPTPQPGGDTPDSGDSYVYPLPVASKATFAFIVPNAVTADVTIHIFDFAGKLARTLTQNMNVTGTVSKAETDLSALSPGIYYYILEAKTDTGNTIKYKTGKFIVKR
jgi:hypothetical protein